MCLCLFRKKCKRQEDSFDDELLKLVYDLAKEVKALKEHILSSKEG